MVSELLAIGGAVIGVVVWLVRIEGRVNSHEQRHLDHVNMNNREHQQHHKRHEEMREDITYIRDRIDRAINKGPA